MDYFNKVLQLADDTTKRYKPESLKWMWGEALLMHSLGMFNDLLEEERYTKYIKNYADAHIKKGLRIDQSDTLAPTLATYYLQKKFDDPKYKEVTNRGLDYIKNSEKVINNMPNHLGTSPEGKFYPKSIWVDSIMMYGVFCALYGKENNEKWLMDFAKTQPKFFANYLQDENTKMFIHSYWTKAKKKHPKNVFWGRGNGWVVAGFPMLIEHLEEGEEKEEALKILREISETILTKQRGDGHFGLLINDVNETKKESSATALIASGWLHGVRMGYLDEKFKEPAIKAFKAVVDDLDEVNGLLSMNYISGPTIATHLFPKLGYKVQRIMFKERDWTYGLAALFFAAINYKLLMEEQ